MQIRDSLFSQKILQKENKTILFFFSILVIFLLFNYFSFLNIISTHFLIPLVLCCTLLQFLSWNFFVKTEHPKFKIFFRDFLISISIASSFIFFIRKSISGHGGELGDIVYGFYFLYLLVILGGWLMVGRPILSFHQYTKYKIIIYNRYTPAIWAVVLTILTFAQAIYQKIT